MKKTSKLSLLLIGGLLLTSVAFVACNNSEEKKDTPKTDTPAVAPAKVDTPTTAPAKPDSGMDKANTKPTPTPNQ